MPHYCYKHKDCEKEYDLICSNAEREKMQEECWNKHAVKGIEIANEIYIRDFKREWQGRKQVIAKYPYYSEVMGVDGSPESIRAAKEESIRLGVPTDFTSTGEAVIRDPMHRKKFAEALGYYDKNSYGSRYDAVRKAR